MYRSERVIGLRRRAMTLALDVEAVEKPPPFPCGYTRQTGVGSCNQASCSPSDTPALAAPIFFGVLGTTTAQDREHHAFH